MMESCSSSHSFTFELWPCAVPIAHHIRVGNAGIRGRKAKLRSTLLIARALALSVNRESLAPDVPLSAHCCIVSVV